MDHERSANALDEEADVEPQVPAALRDAAERLLAQRRAGPTASRWSSDQERLTTVLQLLGRLNEHRQHAAGLFTEDDVPADEVGRSGGDRLSGRMRSRPSSATVSWPTRCSECGP